MLQLKYMNFCQCSVIAVKFNNNNNNIFVVNEKYKYIFFTHFNVVVLFW